MHGDADTDLMHYPDGAFDYVVLSRTLQAVEQPRAVLRQMLRIGARAVVSFPNFGHWQLRLQLLTRGRMPVTPAWDRMWYETPNIHPCTIHDFFDLCAARATWSIAGWPPTMPGGGRLGGGSRAWRICSASRGCSCCAARVTGGGGLGVSRFRRCWPLLVYLSQSSQRRRGRK